MTAAAAATARPGRRAAGAAAERVARARPSRGNNDKSRLGTAGRRSRGRPCHPEPALSPWPALTVPGGAGGGGCWPRRGGGAMGAPRRRGAAHPPHCGGAGGRGAGGAPRWRGGMGDGGAARTLGKAGRGGRRPGGGGGGGAPRPRVLWRSGGARREKKSAGARARALSALLLSLPQNETHTGTRSFLQLCVRMPPPPQQGATRRTQGSRPSPVRGRGRPCACTGLARALGETRPERKIDAVAAHPRAPPALGRAARPHPAPLAHVHAGAGMHAPRCTPPTLTLPSPFHRSPQHTHTLTLAAQQFLFFSFRRQHSTMANMQGQDWNPVILSKRRPGAKEAQTPAVRVWVKGGRWKRRERGGEFGEAAALLAPRAPPPPPTHLSLTRPLFSLSLFQALQAALRAGQVEAVKKFGGANKAHGAAGATKDAAKLDRETEELSHERYGGREQREREGKTGGGTPRTSPRTPTPTPTPTLTPPPPSSSSAPPSLTHSVSSDLKKRITGRPPGQEDDPGPAGPGGQREAPGHPGVRVGQGHPLAGRPVQAVPGAGGGPVQQAQEVSMRGGGGGGGAAGGECVRVVL